MIFNFNKLGKKNTCVVFLHGFLNDGSTWNTTFKTKINIEKKIQKKISTLNITFQIIDYLIPYNKCCEKIYNFIKKENIEKIIIVCHSIGGIYAKWFYYLYNNIKSNIIFIESTCMNEQFIDELKNDINTEKNMIKKNMFINMINHSTKYKIIYDSILSNITKNIFIVLIDSSENDINLEYWNKFSKNITYFI